MSTILQNLTLKHSKIMSESHLDEYEHYNFDQDKYLSAGHSGKQRTKQEAREHQNREDPGGHTRKLVTKMQNTEAHKKEEVKEDRKRTSSKTEEETKS
ncbi:unnamed protein product [Cyprideis torosa]|uniref:Uncharacterized protein n=1 Tax=Cyprideis torosa TaxID=163714 RepID=A0A7R8WPT8_9CRUS|nr:unnamed protein product [Cyprideis torosa]CAG0907486.1 unnamed protein product [Cyprideis torosa]